MKNLYLVIQQGGSSTEMYVHAHDSLADARADVKGCAKAAYNTVGPVKVPAALTKPLYADKQAEQEFYSLIEEIVKGVAKI